MAFYENNTISSEYTFRTSDTAGKLISVVDTLLKDNKCNPQDLQFLVVSYGPGFWTGIRVGIGVAKGIAAGTNAKIYCVGTMDSIFFGIKEFKIPALCIINAYRGQFYLASFNGKFVYRRNYPVKIVTSEDLYRICKGKKWILTGTALSILPDKIKKMKNVVLLGEKFTYPSAGLNTLLALEKIYRGIPSAPLKPFYGR